MLFFKTKMRSITNGEMYDLLQRIKRDGVIASSKLSDDEKFLADRLVSLSLAMKVTTLLDTFYFYGVPQ